jgi:ABC-type lipoprotein release transport system permease subunit
VDLHRRSQFSAVVLEDEVMSYFLTFIAGCMMGGIFGVFTMCMMIQAGQADDREERWFDGRSDK